MIAGVPDHVAAYAAALKAAAAADVTWGWVADICLSAGLGGFRAADLAKAALHWQRVNVDRKALRLIRRWRKVVR